MSDSLHKPLGVHFVVLLKGINNLTQQSLNHDKNEANQDFTAWKLKESLKSCSNKKSIGLDFIPCILLKIIANDYYLATILLRMTNIVCNLSTCPEELHISKLFLLKRKPIINNVDERRGRINTNNLTTVINKMRFDRIKLHYYISANNIGCELMSYAFHTIIYDIKYRYAHVSLVQSDL